MDSGVLTSLIAERRLRGELRLDGEVRKLCAYRCCAREDLAMKNHSAPLGCIISPAQSRTNEKIFLPRQTVGGQRFGPLLYWLAAFFLAPGPVLGASQADLQPALVQFSQKGSKLVGTFAVGPGEQGWSVALSADGTPPSWAGLPTTLTPGRRGSIAAAAVSGPSRAASWLALARLDPPSKASPSRCPLTATPPSWPGLSTTGAPGRRGSTPSAMVSGPSRATS